MTLVAERRIACAACASPPAIALRTDLIAERTRERWADFSALRAFDWRARLRACLLFAIVLTCSVCVCPPHAAHGCAGFPPRARCEAINYSKPTLTGQVPGLPAHRQPS